MATIVLSAVPGVVFANVAVAEILFTVYTLMSGASSGIIVLTPIFSGHSITIVGVAVHEKSLLRPVGLLSTIVPILSPSIVTVAFGVMLHFGALIVMRGFVTYPAPFSEIFTVYLPAASFTIVAFAGITGGSIVSVGFFWQTQFVSFTLVTIPFHIVAVAVGFVVQPTLPTVIFGTPMYPEPLFVTVAIVPELSSTTAVAVIFGADTVRSGFLRPLHTPPDKMISTTLPSSIMAVAVGAVVQAPVASTVTVGGAT